MSPRSPRVVAAYPPRATGLPETALPPKRSSLLNSFGEECAKSTGIQSLRREVSHADDALRCQRARRCHRAMASHLKARWWAVPRPRGMVVVAHGLGEHGGAYAPPGRGDQPGSRSIFWRSIFGVTGEVPDGGEWSGDTRTWWRTCGPRSPGRGVVRPGVPLFLLGHSNGGQVVLRLALEGVDGLRGSSPRIPRSGSRCRCRRES